jgi:hypothetical protein
MAAGEIDLARHRHGPGECLIDAEQYVGGDDPPPVRRKEDQKRDRQTGKPSYQHHRLAADPVRQSAGDEIQQSLHHAEGHDKRREEQVGAVRNSELPAQRGQYGALHPDGEADEEYLHGLQRKLAKIGADAARVGWDDEVHCRNA